MSVQFVALVRGDAEADREPHQLVIRAQDATWATWIGAEVDVPPGLEHQTPVWRNHQVRIWWCSRGGWVMVHDTPDDCGHHRPLCLVCGRRADNFLDTEMWPRFCGRCILPYDYELPPVDRAVDCGEVGIYCCGDR